jgi:hypothetical protein
LIASSGYVLVCSVTFPCAVSVIGSLVDVGPDEVADEGDLARDDVDRRDVDVLAVADDVEEAAVLDHRDAVSTAPFSPTESMIATPRGVSRSWTASMCEPSTLTV